MEKYSVLMAVYYREKPAHLRQAVESMLAQTAPPEEFVLVCDGPLTPELDSVIAEFCSRNPPLFQVVRLEQNRGLGAALNAGLLRCSNELVARMDSDDMALPDRMERQLEKLRKHPQISALGGQIAEFDTSPQRITAYRTVPCHSGEIREYLRSRSPMNHTTVVLRKSHVLQVGGYREVPGFEDYFLWGRLLSAGFRLRNIPQVCCAVRADEGMYVRRGGVIYFRNAVKLEGFLLEQNLITRQEYWRNVLIRFGGTVLLPSFARRWAFQKFLRKRELLPVGEPSGQGKGIRSSPGDGEFFLPGMFRDTAS